jgi:hypothetical protein
LCNYNNYQIMNPIIIPYAFGQKYWYATLYIYLKRVIGQKIHVKAWRFESEMWKNDKNDENNVILNL